jgi:hypothetical protein
VQFFLPLAQNKINEFTDYFLLFFLELGRQNHPLRLFLHTTPSKALSNDVSHIDYRFSFDRLPWLGSSVAVGAAIPQLSQTCAHPLSWL